ncbi:MAG: hypothetical protein NZ455_03065 [Bacteroidia bacterium]|nr:hypothetical protein [Bacteroidia bacterium]
MRHAEGVHQHGAKPLAQLLHSCLGGGRVGRSTEAKCSPQHADPSAARDTPKKSNQSNYLLM